MKKPMTVALAAWVVALGFTVAFVGSIVGARNAHAGTTPLGQSVLESLPANPELVSGDKLLGAITAIREKVTPQALGCGWKDGISEDRLNLYAYKMPVSIPGIGAFEISVYTLEMRVGEAAWYLDIYPELDGLDAYVVNSRFAHGVVLDGFLEWLKAYSPQVHAFIVEGKGDCRPAVPGTAI